MGNFCSKSSTLSGGHQVLGGSESNTNVRGEDEEARRARIAEAAQRRLEENRTRGVKATNPKAGELSKKLVLENAQVKTPASDRQADQLVWD